MQSLGQRWNAHLDQELRLRYEVGKSLNARLGPPTKPNFGEEGFLWWASAATNISERMLNRMRWFAFKFASVDKFKEAYPSAHAWREVSLVIRDLAQRDYGNSIGKDSN